MHNRKVLYADSSFEDLRDFENALATVDATVVHGNCKTPAEVMASGSDAVCIVTEPISLGERATTHKK
jgi:metallophosphoesterase superfamily enzyme